MTEPFTEPAPDGLALVHEEGRSLRGRYEGVELFRYVYRPWDPPMESPRPYFHPVRTLSGALVSLYRPHDHVWHKGIAWSLSNVGDENFWGGPTYLRGVGYRQLENNGRMSHVEFTGLGLTQGVLRFDERLDWITAGGATHVEERRQTAVRVLPAAGAWQLAFRTVMRNVSGAPIRIGSPTTEGRENAGYSGLFWRGPRSFSGGRVVTPAGEGGDELMGTRHPWLGYVGRHDGSGGASTLVFLDHADNQDHPTRWFVRTGIFACVCPAPFFGAAHSLAAGDTLTLRYDVVVADGARDTDGCATLAKEAGRLELA